MQCSVGRHAAIGIAAFHGELLLRRDRHERELDRAQPEREGDEAHDLKGEEGPPYEGEAELAARLARPRGKRSMATHLKRTLGLGGAKAALLREGAGAEDFADPARLAARLKALPLTLHRPRPIAEAISTAGGVARDALSGDYELNALPGVFAVGEMLDWDAPTGGYLLSACLATGRQAGEALARRLE